jgi:hypothetical protein
MQRTDGHARWPDKHPDGRIFPTAYARRELNRMRADIRRQQRDNRKVDYPSGAPVWQATCGRARGLCSRGWAGQDDREPRVPLTADEKIEAKLAARGRDTAVPESKQAKMTED